MANAVRRPLISIFGICAIAWAIDAILGLSHGHFAR